MGWMGIRVQIRSDHPQLAVPAYIVQIHRESAASAAKGFIAIGQFAYGVITISQFGIGVFSLSQFTIAGFAVAQMAVAYSPAGSVWSIPSSGPGPVGVGLGRFVAAPLLVSALLTA